MGLTIEQLPYELIQQILLHLTDSLSPCSIPKTLSQISQLSQTLYDPASSLLYSSVHLSNSATAHKWLTSKATDRFHCGELEIVGIVSGNNGLTGNVGRRCIEKAKGLRRLVVGDFKSLGVKVLLNEGLEGEEQVKIVTRR